MKRKNLKSFVATILAAVIALSCFNVSFAASETIIWDLYEETYSYEYAGSLIEGENGIGNPESNSSYYTFDAQEAGFYVFTYNYYNASWRIDIAESFENDTAQNSVDQYFFYDEDEEEIENFLVYLEKGEQIIGVENYYSEDGEALIIEYMGEEITSFETESETLLLGQEIHCYSEEYEGEDEAYYYSLYSDVTVTFSSGKTITINDLWGEISEEIQKGENVLPYEFLGKEYEFRVKVELITDYIENVEISNVEDYHIKEYYSHYDFPSLDGETLTVTFKDGSTAEYTFGIDEEFVLPNGKETWFGFGFYVDDGDAFLEIYIANTVIKTYDCGITGADFSENKEMLKSNIIEQVNNFSYYLRRAMIIALECDSFEEYVSYGLEESLMRFRWACEAFVGIFTESFYLIGYYL